MNGCMTCIKNCFKMFSLKFRDVAEPLKFGDVLFKCSIVTNFIDHHLFD